jgi:hypothetical protein
MDSIHNKKMLFKKYDNSRYIVYLNEKVIENYRNEEEEGEREPFTAFSYTGAEPDGGTIIDVDPNEELQNALINGVLRTKYSVSVEDAIKTHQVILFNNPEHAKADEYKAEFAQFNDFREDCIATVRGWFA